MAFNPKYRFHIYGNGVGTYWRVDLLKDGYSGSVNDAVDLDADAALNITQQGNGGEKYFTSSKNVFKGTSATLRIFIANSTLKAEFDEFATLSSGTWIMAIYKGTSPGNETIYHTLLVQPDVFSYPYEEPPYFVSITATDELGTLSGIAFDNGGSPYILRKSVMYFIFEILSKLTLGPDRQVKSVCNVFADGMATDDPLWQATVDPTKYVNNRGRENEEVWNCAEVLNDLLKPYGVILFLGNADTWRIHRINDVAADSYQENLYSTSDEVASFESISNHIVNTNGSTGSDIMTFINSPLVQVGWRWKKVHFRIYTGGNENFIFRGDLSPAFWTGANSLLYWSITSKGPSADPIVKYGDVTPFPEVPLIERVEVFEDVKHMAGEYISGDVDNSTIYSFSTVTVGGSTYNQLFVSINGDDSPWQVGDEVFLGKANAAVMPMPLGSNRAYYIRSYSNDNFKNIFLSTTANGSVIDLTTGGSGTRLVGLAETTQVTYAMQINGYQTTEYTSGDITNKLGQVTAATYVLAGDGNTMSLSFFWKLIFDNSDEFQSNAAYGYWQLTITTEGGVVYYYNKNTYAWQTAAVGNVLEDDYRAYGWVKEQVDRTEIPVSGRMEFMVYQPSSALNTELLGIQIANIESAFSINGITDAEYIDKVGEVGEDYADTADMLELHSGDLPSTAYKGHIGFGGALAVDWFRRGVTEEKELIDILIQSYMNNYGRTTLKIQGNLMGDFLPGQIIEDQNLNYEIQGVTVTPRLMLLGGTLNVEDGVWSGEWVEINE